MADCYGVCDRAFSNGDCIAPHIYEDQYSGFVRNTFSIALSIFDP